MNSQNQANYTFNAKIASINTWCIMHFHFLLLLLKIFLSLLIDISISLIFESPDFTIWFVWIMVSGLIDIRLIIKPPKFFKGKKLTPEQQHKYGFNNEDLVKYLNFWPKARLVNSFLLFSAVFPFLDQANWFDGFCYGFIIFFLIINPILRTIFKIKIPLTYKPAPLGFNKVLAQVEAIRKNMNPSHPGSHAWIAEETLKQIRAHINRKKF